MITHLRNLVLGICVATILLEGVVLLKTWSDGSWKRWNVHEILAIIYGVDRESIDDMRRRLAPVKVYESTSAAERERIEQGKVLDFDMRERSISTALEDLREYRTQLDSERVRYEQLRTDFESQLSRIEGIAQDADLVRLRETIESLDAAQAKDQLMALLKRADDSGDFEIANDVVVLIKTMPMDKRRKILSEFQTDAERERLAFIMRELRLGNPEIPLIRSVGERLREFDPPDPQDST